MSHQTFIVGEIAEIAVSDLPDFPVGMEVPILSPLLPCFCGCGFACHIIGRDEIGRNVWSPPECLRKKRPPQDWKTLCHLTDAARETESA